MFFEPSDFNNLPNPAHKRIAAITANNMLKDLGVVLCGRFYEDGKALDFSTEFNNATDTHTCVAILMENIGAKRRHGAPVKIETEIREKDKAAADRDYREQLEIENKNLRAQNGK